MRPALELAAIVTVLALALAFVPGTEVAQQELAVPSIEVAPDQPCETQLAVEPEAAVELDAGCAEVQCEQVTLAPERPSTPSEPHEETARPAAGSAPVEVEIRVEDPTGAPASHAWIAVEDRTFGPEPPRVRHADRQGRVTMPMSPNFRCDVFATDLVGRYGFAIERGFLPRAGELVLRLGAARDIVVSVRTADGTGLGPFAVRSVRTYGRSTNLEAFERVSISRSDGCVTIPVELSEFWVQAIGPSYQLAEQGPFRAESAPSSVSLVVEPVAEVTGVVLQDGEPVDGVRVGLYAAWKGTGMLVGNVRARSSPKLVQEFATSRDGSFSGVVRRPGTYYLRAEKPFGQVSAWDTSPASIELGPFELGPGRGRTGLVLALSEGGRIAGHVLLPDRALPGELALVATRGDGFLRFQQPVTETFTFEHLIPGEWRVEVRRRSYRVGKRSASPDEQAAPWRRTCSVVEGATSSLELDLRDLPEDSSLIPMFAAPGRTGRR